MTAIKTRRRPRVLLLSATPRSDRGGVQRMMDRLEEELPKQGFDTRRAGPDEDADSGMRLVLEAGAGRSGRPAMLALPGAGVSFVRLARLLASFRPDVVNLHFLTGAVAYLIALRPIFGFQMVLSAHGTDLHEPSEAMRARLPGFLAAADAVTTVSAELGRVATGFGPSPDKLHVIPNGADTDFWCPGPSGPTPDRIVAAGRLLPVKGFDILLDAVAGLGRGQVVIAGEGQDRPLLEARIADLGLQDRVRLAGHLDREGLRQQLRDAALFAMPSRREGMPVALIEALACGTPAVATRMGGIPEVLTSDTGIVVPPEDPQAFRAALAAALSGQAGLDRGSARRRAEAFSDAACLGRYGALFRKLAGLGDLQGAS